MPKQNALIYRILCFLLFSVLLNTSSLLAQIDAIGAQLSTMDSLAKEVFWTKEPDSAFYYIEQMLSLAREHDKGVYIRRGLKYRVQLYYALDDFESALANSDARIEAYESATYDIRKRYRALASSYREKANALRKLGRITEALENFERSIQYGQAIEEDGLKSLGSTLNDLGNMYFNLREYELAKEKYEASLQIHRQVGRDMGIYSNLNNLGLIHAKTGKYAKAIEYYEQSLAMKRKANDQARISNTLGNIGDIYFNWGKEDEAEAYFLEAKAIQEELALREDLPRSLTQLGNLALLRGKPEEAVEWCNQSCGIAGELMLWQAQLDCSKCLYEAQKQLQNFEQALTHYEFFKAIEDSIFRADDKMEIATLEARLDYQEQLAEAEAQQAQLAADARSERLLRWLLIGIALALAALSWLAIRIGRRRRVQNQLLLEKNQQISQQTKALEETAALRSRFFTNISHELRTPLTLVTSPLEQLLSKTDNIADQDRKTLQTAHHNAGKLIRLVDELLELAQLEAGQVKVEQEVLQLEPFLRQLFNNYELLAEEKGIDYQLISSIDKNLTVRTDPARLEKIIDNLLSNALKFTQENGRVSMRLEQVEESDQAILQVKVTDSGPGISEEDLKHIFNRHYRGAATKHSSGGIGIGLALAQESAQLLGGRLVVDSKPAQGTTFHLYLPLLMQDIQANSPQEAQAAPSPVLTESAQHAANRILIVEDNPELRAFLSDVLSDYSHGLANDGKQALKALKDAAEQEKPYDLLLTDLMMPNVDGSELIQQIQADEQYAKLRIVVLSARNTQTEKLNFLRIGVDDFLTKPFSPEELRLRINKLLQHKIIPTPLPAPTTDTPPSSTSSWLKEVEKSIELKLATQQELTASTIARDLNISNRQLLRKVKTATGLSTQKYIQECKLQLAQRYLTQRKYETISAVAKACGFQTTSYFKRVFLERFGKSPDSFLSDEID